MTDTLRSYGGSIEKYRDRDHDDAAIEWQVDFLHEHLPFNLYAYDDEYEGGLVHIAGPYSTKDEIRETLRRYPRDEFMFQYEYYQAVQVFRRRQGRTFRSFFWVTRKHEARDLPLSFNHGRARYCEQRFRTHMWLPNGGQSVADTEGKDCWPDSGSVPKGSDTLKKYGRLTTRSGAPVSLYVKTRPSKMKRSDIVWAIASTVAAGGASPSEMEVIVRSSLAFKSKRAEYGDNYSEAEIKRLRRKLYVSRWN